MLLLPIFFFQSAFSGDDVGGTWHGICMAVSPADTELDLKTLAAASGNRKIHLVSVKDPHKLTGYIRGGVTALAAKKSYPVYADNSIERFDHISISAGIRGLHILLAPADYLKITKATLAAIAQGKRRSGITDPML
jgi:Cys-tRNA(Pro)/Cys-tRNA(Cys) deacylase